jgi:hypothetical protein
MPLTPVLENVTWQPANPSPGERAEITLTHSTEGSGGTKPTPAAKPRRVIDVLLFTPDRTDARLVEIGIALLENETDTTTVPFDVPQTAGEYTMRVMYFDDGDQIPPRVLNIGTMVVGDVETNESSTSVDFQSAQSPSAGRVFVRYDVKNKIVSGDGQNLTATIETTVDGNVVDSYDQPTEPGETIPVVRQIDGVATGDKEVCVRVV